MDLNIPFNEPVYEANDPLDPFEDLPEEMPRRVHVRGGVILAVAVASVVVESLRYVFSKAPPDPARRIGRAQTTLLEHNPTGDHVAFEIEAAVEELIIMTRFLHA